MFVGFNTTFTFVPTQQRLEVAHTRPDSTVKHQWNLDNIHSRLVEELHRSEKKLPKSTTSTPIVHASGIPP